MKKSINRVLLFFYVAFVLLLSMRARAAGNYETVGVKDASFNKTSSVISVYGTLPNPCHITPQVIVRHVDESNAIVYFDVRVTAQKEFCASVLGEDFAASYDLEQMPLQPGKIYNLVFESIAGDQIAVEYRAQETVAWQIKTTLENRIKYDSALNGARFAPRTRVP